MLNFSDQISSLQEKRTQAEYQEKYAIYDYYRKYAHQVHDSIIISIFDESDAILCDMIGDSRISVNTFIKFISDISFNTLGGNYNEN